MEQLYKAKTGYNVREVLDQLPPTLSVRNERSGNKYLTPILKFGLREDLAQTGLETCESFVCDIIIGTYLQGELLDSMYRGTIVSVPLFKDLDEGCVREICLAMKPFAVLRGAYLTLQRQIRSKTTSQLVRDMLHNLSEPACLPACSNR
jgi:hypothetical protein